MNTLREKVRLWRATGMTVTLGPERVKQIAEELDAMDREALDALEMSERHLAEAKRHLEKSKQIIARVKGLIWKINQIAIVVVIITLINIAITVAVLTH